MSDSSNNLLNVATNFTLSSNRFKLFHGAAWTLIGGGIKNPYSWLTRTTKRQNTYKCKLTEHKKWL